MLRRQRPLPRGHRRLEATATRSSPLPSRPVIPIGRLFAGRLRYPRESLRNAPSRKDPHGTPRRYRPRLQFGSPSRLRDQAGRCRQALPHVGRREEDGWPCRLRDRRGPLQRGHRTSRNRAERPAEAGRQPQLRARRYLRHRRAAQLREFQSGDCGHRDSHQP